MARATSQLEASPHVIRPVSRQVAWQSVNNPEQVGGADSSLVSPQRGEHVWPVKDDTCIGKPGQKIACVKMIERRATKRYVQRPMVATAVVRFRHINLPWEFRLFTWAGLLSSLANIRKGMPCV